MARQFEELLFEPPSVDPLDAQVADIVGPEPVPQEFTPEDFQPTTFERILEGIQAGTAGRSAQPRNFLQGLATGGIGGLAQGGARVASARERFSRRQIERRKQVDEANRKATEDDKKRRFEARSGLLKEGRGAAADVAKEGRKAEAEAVEITPEIAARFPALNHLVGQKVGERVLKLFTDETPTEKSKRAAADDVNVDLSPEYLDIAARGVLSGLPLSNFIRGRGKSAATQFAAIANRVGRMDPKADLAFARAGYGADLGSLKKAQLILDGLKSFKVGTQKNMENLRDLVKKVPDLGFTPLNAAAREISLMLGNKDMAKFRVFQSSVSTEAARIINNANIYLDLGEQSRKDLDALKGGSLSVAQTLAALDALNIEFANRTKAQDETLDVISERIKHRGSAPNTAPGPSGLTDEQAKAAFKEYMNAR